MSASSIEGRGLSRTFHTTVRRPGFVGGLRPLVNPERLPKYAVSDVTFDVAPGELLALLGPNGAGKSTTIEVLTGILTPTSGAARVAGVVPYQERERNARNIGAVFGQSAGYWSRWVEDLLGTFGNYPLNALPRAGGFLTYGLPLAFVAFLPAAVLTRHGHDIEVPYWPAASSSLVGVLTYLGARLLWRWSLGHYTGVNG